MGCLLKNIYSLTQNVAKSKRELKYSPHVRKCVSYISKNLNKKITVASVAAELGLSADYISHLFRKETGTALGSYIMKRRLEAARTLLWEGADISQVCDALCFCSKSHFTAVFKKEYGTTPGEFAAAVKPKK